MHKLEMGWEERRKFVNNWGIREIFHDLEGGFLDVSLDAFLDTLQFS
ncbi:hypothetical protein [Alloscardovia omnicolens]|nr:hypothetical protein [Alloscardovia omnicolens]